MLNKVVIGIFNNSSVANIYIIKPNTESLREIDNKYLVTNYGDNISIDFEPLPKGVKVIAAQIISYGYYEFYKNMQNRWLNYTYDVELESENSARIIINYYNNQISGKKFLDKQLSAVCTQKDCSGQMDVYVRNYVQSHSEELMEEYVKSLIEKPKLDYTISKISVEVLE